MQADPCQEFHLLIQADIDGELTANEAAGVAVHVAGCPACAKLQADLLALRLRLRGDLPRSAAGAATRAAVAKRLAAMPGAERNTGRRSSWAAFAGGIALAASVLLALPLADLDGTGGELVAAHVQALQSGKVIAVESSDRHTVKPWFDGKITFAPAVKDLAAHGFPLIGGRTDVVDGRTVAVMVYRRGQHMIDVFAWPSAALETWRATLGLNGTRTRDGFATAIWASDGITYRAVASVDIGEMRHFVAQWQAR